MKKRFLNIAAKIMSVLLIVVALSAGFLLLGKSKALTAEIDNVDLSRIPDGIYVGAFSDFRWSNKVQVTVDDHRIVNIQILKKQIVDSKQVMDTLIQTVITAQTPNVDAVSGATADSNAYLKAIENALQ
ncbi:MAG: FMN-binding protein [Anaerofustis sp.]